VLCGQVRPATSGPACSPLPRPEPTAATPALGRALQATYDYIVVGAGSAGCVVASRLSEDPDVSVLLIEAGGSNQRFMVRSPFVTCPLLQNTSLDWAYRTTRQATTDDRVSFWPRGKCLGGCSSINFMIYCRGDPRNYDHWAQKLGCDGWSYEEVLPFFKRSENLLEEGGAEAELHGRGGPLQVTQMSEHDFVNKEICEQFVESCGAAGLPRGDYNGREQRGASLTQVTVKDGVRCDTASAFLFGTGALARPNLTVLTDAMVTRVVLQGLEATGVCVQTKGKAEPPVFLSASKEVVLSCGAVGTPQLLLLSGLGPRAHLEEHGIGCVRDLPVGENLQDHIMWPLPYGLKPGVPAALSPQRPVTGGLLGGLAKHLLFGTGVLSFPMVQAVAFGHSGTEGSDEAEGNDMQLHWLGFAGGFDKNMMERNFGIVPREDRPMTRLDDHPDLFVKEGVTFLSTLVLPKSTGFVRLASADPAEPPIIEPRYLSDPRDLAVCAAATRLARRVAREPPLRDALGEMVNDPSIPHDPESDEYIHEYVRRSCITVYHPVGTAKMGAADDPTAVVDPRLRVRGVRRLCVADASVMPSIVSGNTNAPSVMIGERLAAFLQEDQRRG